MKYAIIDVKCAELCQLEEELAAAIGTPDEPIAKIRLTAKVKEVNLELKQFENNKNQ